LNIYIAPLQEDISKSGLVPGFTTILKCTPECDGNTKIQFSQRNAYFKFNTNFGNN